MRKRLPVFRISGIATCKTRRGFYVMAYCRELDQWRPLDNHIFRTHLEANRHANLEIARLDVVSMLGCVFTPGKVRWGKPAGESVDAHARTIAQRQRMADHSDHSCRSRPLVTKISSNEAVLG